MASEERVGPSLVLGINPGHFMCITLPRLPYTSAWIWEGRTHPKRPLCRKGEMAEDIQELVHKFFYFLKGHKHKTLSYFWPLDDM